MRVPGGGAPLAWVWGVQGQALSHPRPLVLSGVRPGPTTQWLWARGVRAWEPVNNPTARALASWLCALWGRHVDAQGGRLLPGCGASGSIAHKDTHPNTPARIGGVQAKTRHHTDAPRTTARIGGVWAERARKHTLPNAPARICGVEAEQAHKDTHRSTTARNGGAQPNPASKHTHPQRTPEPGQVRCTWSAHTNKNAPTPQPGLGR